MTTYNLKKIAQRVAELGTRRYVERVPLGPLQGQLVTAPGQVEEPPFELTAGQRWGQRDSIYRFQFDLTIPAGWQGQPVALHLDLSQPATDWSINGAEGLLSINGQPLHAVDRYHREFLLPTELLSQERLDVTLRVWSGINAEYQVADKLELCRLDPTADQLYLGMSLWLEALAHLKETSPAYVALATALDEACQLLDFRGLAEPDFYTSCGLAAERLERRLVELDLSEFVKQHPDWQPHVTGIGHAHIDVAWLWRLSHTRIKAANTFSSALYHMDRYPYFTFIQSQPQLYQFVKEDQPAIYARIKEKVAAGQWEPEGAMWIEADTNITGAESLARQFLFGQRFFQQEFGYRCKVLWLPDVFGYSAALPQLIKLGGAEYFVTSKLSWNDTNRMPADTFWWQGLDGSQVLTYFLTAQNDDVWPAYTYNGEVKPGVLTRGWRNYKQKEASRDILLAYGWGDGGGGPTREMIEAIEVLERPISTDLPIVRSGKVADFMDRLAERAAGHPAVPRWVGELYFEYHRGTYTSQSRVKRANRQAERDLHNTELLATLAGWLTGQTYPREELNVAWRTVLTHHFHDILPGSSIGEVYADAAENYAQVKQTTDRLAEAAQEGLAARLDAPEGSLVVFNTLGWPRRELVELDRVEAARLSLPSQELTNGRALVEVSDVPGFGYRVYAPGEEEDEDDESLLRAGPSFIENEYYRLELNERGQLSRLYDREAERELLPEGARANVLQLFEDKPLNFNAWDIDAFYEQKMWELDGLVSVQVIEEGPLRAGLALEWSYADRTRVWQKLYLYANSRRIDFVTEIDWQERQTLLKAAFPLDLHSARATAEIQWGNIERPTHRNTSWDAARFETCAHKWVDLSEGDYGVALLNDCKYGYDIHDNVLRLTLLKGAIDPDPKADLGRHQFTYSLWPHRGGGWYEGGVHRAAYGLNYPLLPHLIGQVSQGGDSSLPRRFSLMVAQPSNVVVETIKQAEDSSDWIVRLYECANRRGPFELQLAWPLSAVQEVNFLEEELLEQTVKLGSTGLTIRGRLRPYEIKTLRLTPA